LDALTPEQVGELIDWKFQSMPHRRALARRGITPERWESASGQTGAGDVIRWALASRDDFESLAVMARQVGGIYRFGPAMGSVVLAACQPAVFTIADTRALYSLRALGLLEAGPPYFYLDNWLPYLVACRGLAERCDLSLRQVDRALWIAAEDPGLASPG
jgi:hypothetical protein